MTMILALFDMPWSELEALIALIGTVCGVFGSIALLYLNSKYASKKLHYHDKDEIWVAISESQKLIEKIDRDAEIAKQPIVTMEGAVKEMKAELEKLVSTIGAMDKSITATLGDFNTRVTVLEKTRAPRRSSGGR
jgi:bacillopeptidase F (M6 metalloprotease family)